MVLRTATYIARINLSNQNEMESLIVHLRSLGYKPLIRNMLRCLFSSVNLSEPDEDLTAQIIKVTSSKSENSHKILGDLFLTENMIYIFVVEESMLLISCIGYERQWELLHKFCMDIEESIKFCLDDERVKDINFEWLIGGISVVKEVGIFKPGIISEPPDDFKITNPNYTRDEVKASYLLVDSTAREFLRELCRRNKMKSGDTIKFIDSETAQSLFSSDLIEKKNSVYTISKKGRKMTASSLWMQIWITELLKANGVEEDSIYWAIQSDSDEIDIMVSDFDSCILLELKDREFGLGDLHSFLFRMHRFDGDKGLIITTKRVSSEVKKNLKDSTEIVYLEGQENIQSGIEDIIEKMAMEYIRRFLKPFSDRIGFDILCIVESWKNAIAFDN